ncbi:MAG: hypothetical protein AAF225_11270 [Pseudomonadota bacterium]
MEHQGERRKEGTHKVIDRLPSTVPTPSPSGGPTAGNKLSDEQRKGLNDILAQFDAETLNSSDANKIVEQVKELNIRPSRAFFSAVFEAGFEPRQIAELAELPITERPPSVEINVNKEALAELARQLGDVTIRDASREQLGAALKTLAEMGYDLSEPLVDIRF